MMTDEARRILADGIDLLNEIESLRAEVQRLTEQQRWIPCSERLPEDEEEVLATAPGDFPNYAVAYVYKGHWQAGYDIHPTYDMSETELAFEPTHWMPLPPFPSQEKDDG